MELGRQGSAAFAPGVHTAAPSTPSQEMATAAGHAVDGSRRSAEAKRAHASTSQRQGEPLNRIPCRDLPGPLAQPPALKCVRHDHVFLFPFSASPEGSIIWLLRYRGLWSGTPAYRCSRGHLIAVSVSKATSSPRCRGFSFLKMIKITSSYVSENYIVMHRMLRKIRALSIRQTHRGCWTGALIFMTIYYVL